MRLPRGGSVIARGVMEPVDHTVTLAVAVLLSESVTRITSVTEGVRPAVYRPPTSVPPERLVTNAQVKPVPLPPEGVKVRAPRGGAWPVAGASVTPAVTV